VRAVITKESFIGSTKSVESAMRDGHILVLIIEDELDQFTSEILNAKVTEASGSKIIEYNKNILHVNANFRLLLCNKSRNPNLSSKLYISSPILNFEITKNMLKSILLQELLVLENREIYNIRKGLEQERKMNEKVIAEVEEMIIDSLISSKKTLIDDNEFINLLSENQTKRAVLKENEAEWRQKTANIKKIYDSYADITELMGRISTPCFLGTRRYSFSTSRRPSSSPSQPRSSTRTTTKSLHPERCTIPTSSSTIIVWGWAHPGRPLHCHSSAGFLEVRTNSGRKTSRRSILLRRMLSRT
jgi:hypothetical protein